MHFSEIQIKIADDIKQKHVHSYKRPICKYGLGQLLIIQSNSRKCLCKYSNNSFLDYIVR
jgi:hypothetical protein